MTASVPYFPVYDQADMGLANPKTLCNLRLGLAASKITDKINVLLSQSSRRVSFFRQGRAVLPLIGQILFLRGPSKMLRVDASEVAFPAVMGGDMLRGWWRPMCSLTNHSRNELPAASIPDHRPPVFVPVKRPYVAFFATVIDSLLKFFSRTIPGCFRGGGTGPHPSRIMGLAPRSGVGRFLAILDRTCSHFVALQAESAIHKGILGT